MAKVKEEKTTGCAALAELRSEYAVTASTVSQQQSTLDQSVADIQTLQSELSQEVGLRTELQTQVSDRKKVKHSYKSDTPGYFSFELNSVHKGEIITITDQYGGCIELLGTGFASTESPDYQKVRCIRKSYGIWKKGSTIADVDGTNAAHKLRAIYFDQGTNHIFVSVGDYTAISVEGIYSDLQFVETLPDTAKLVPQEFAIAQYDKNGKDIADTYATKADVIGKVNKHYSTLTDANTADESGLHTYRVQSNCLNIPIARIGIIISNKYYDGKQYIRITQTYITNDEQVTNGLSYIRYGMSNNNGSTYTWSDWKQFSCLDDATPSTLSTYSSDKIDTTYATKTEVSKLCNNDEIVRRIDKIYFCSSASSEQIKNVNIENFILEKGTCIRVCFENGNSISEPKLKVSGNEFEIIVQGGKRLTTEYGNTTCGAYKWQENTILEFMYNGEFWVVLGNPEIVSKQESYKRSETNLSGLVFSRITSVRIDGFKKLLLSSSGSATGDAGNDRFKRPFEFGLSFESTSTMFAKQELLRCAGSLTVQKIQCVHTDTAALLSSSFSTTGIEISVLSKSDNANIEVEGY